MINLTPSQKFPKNAGDLGKLIVAKACKKLPKVQKIAQSGHTGYNSAIQAPAFVNFFESVQQQQKLNSENIFLNGPNPAFFCLFSRSFHNTMTNIAQI